VTLNRIVCLAETIGDAAALDALESAVRGDVALQRHHRTHAVRGHLLERLGRYADAATELRRAASLTRNLPEQSFLIDRAGRCDARTGVSDGG